ncbi:hypothetical protein JFV30_14195 [Pseudomonas sp. TH32]|uniref:hypothetical protein n=1 Tax=Pseudomonas sp. TH32 TaxID=2796397 RepID=UPI00191304FE|nr:hypothetical protein [Pseudomonas sp. TH32]MBK5437929.1 hypothetical protein [Pseudomonas sp. TH32]
MRWTLYCIVLGLCLCSGLAGLNAGIIFNPKNTVEFLPVWGSLGDWVAGLGTLFAVGVALDQSKRQQDRERANLKITVEHGTDLFSVRLLSNGLTPVTVLAVHMEFDDYESSINLATQSSGNIKLPQKLVLGDTLDLVDFRNTEFSHFGQKLAEPIIGRLSDSGVRPSDGNFGVNEAFFRR